MSKSLLILSYNLLLSFVTSELISTPMIYIYNGKPTTVPEVKQEWLQNNVNINKFSALFPIPDDEDKYNNLYREKPIAYEDLRRCYQSFERTYFNDFFNKNQIELRVKFEDNYICFASFASLLKSDSLIRNVAKEFAKDKLLYFDCLPKLRMLEAARRLFGFRLLLMFREIDELGINPSPKDLLSMYKVLGHIFLLKIFLSTFIKKIINSVIPPSLIETGELFVREETQSLYIKDLYVINYKELKFNIDNELRLYCYNTFERIIQDQELKEDFERFNDHLKEKQEEIRDECLEMKMHKDIETDYNVSFDNDTYKQTNLALLCRSLVQHFFLEESINDFGNFLNEHIETIIRPNDILHHFIKTPIKMMHNVSHKKNRKRKKHYYKHRL